MFKLNFIALLSSILFFCATPTQTTPNTRDIHIFFDLGDVLVKPSSAHGLFKMWRPALAFMFSTGSIPNRNTLLSYLQGAWGPYTYVDKSGITKNSTYLPQCYHAWFTGMQNNVPISSNEFIAQLNEHIDHDTSLGSRHKQILKAATNMMRPENLASITRPIKHALAFLTECVRINKQGGLPTIHLYIVSNWDAESFALLKQQHPDLFTLFEHNNITISGDPAVRMMKPDSGIYEYVLDKYKVRDAALQGRCIFVDDMAENVQAAIESGFTGIVHTDWGRTAKLLRWHIIQARRSHEHKPINPQPQDQHTSMPYVPVASDTYYSHQRTIDRFGQPSWLKIKLIAFFRVLMGLS